MSLRPAPIARPLPASTTKDTPTQDLGQWVVNRQHVYRGTQYSRILWQALRCAVCNRGAVAKLHDNGNSQGAELEEFLPLAVEEIGLPQGVPEDIVKEFRESELDAGNGAYRSASAMLRSVLEKTLRKNGYSEVEITDKSGNQKKSNRLIDRIDAAARDRVITETRQKRAHENIRVLGNDVLHDDWREVTQEEYEEAHKYAQRILEDFYDDRATVEAQLTAQKRPFQK